MLYFKNFLVGLVLILLVKPHRQFLSKYNKNIKEGNITFEKEWKLLTYKTLVDNITYLKQHQMLKTFWERETRIIGEYPLSVGSIPKVTNEDYVPF